MSIENSSRPVSRESVNHLGPEKRRPLERRTEAAPLLLFVFEANGCPLDRALIATGVGPRFSCGFTLCIVE